jgi:UMF1 family MFS transporter
VAQPLPPGASIFSVGFKRLASTFRKVRRYREFIKFMIAFLIYNDGIIMALDFAAILGAVLFGMDQQQLIMFMILVQITSVTGAYLFGILTDRVGSKRSLVLSLLLMIAAASWMFFARRMAEFLWIGALAGFALTGVQSVSRAIISLFSPAGQSAEFYGFFAVAGRTSSFIGPTIYGILAAEAALWFQARGETPLAAEQIGQRVAVLAIIAFLLAGFVMLLAVDERRAREQAKL